MSSVKLQIYGMDSADVEELRGCAASEGVSLSAYLRKLLHEIVTDPTNAEVIRRIEAEEPIQVTTDEICSCIEVGRSR
ncbi:hypothetical protein [Haloglycomyces albus]|uniref:hypothetical protein n=1 Tax=Haloglycomyces albus TaxID=526067 RepID=UPI00046D4DB5|nr:hypothetical protein [Haloglycomyces albus]